MALTLHTASAHSGTNGHAARDGWGRERVSAVSELHPLVERVGAAMAAAGFPGCDAFAVRLALEEAVVNAIKHGHQHDPSKAVRVAYRVGPDRVVLEIEDEGPGFRPADVPDPLEPENLERACGRGVFLMRHYMNEVAFNERGNRVTLCKWRS
jgi:serine/threonine-protein kinase RsbW